MATRFSLVLNGNDVELHDVDPATTLSQWLRSTGAVGTKEGCAEGDCGACTVLVSDLDANGGSVWRSVNACIALLPSFAGREVRTVEGLAPKDGLHPIQAAMVKHGGSQCGYCTPGFVMSMAECYERSDVDATAARHGLACSRLDGNLCRCTGYRPIRDALIDAVRCRDGDLDLVGIGARDRRPPRSTKLAAVDVDVDGHRFIRPATLADLLALKAEHKDARVVAGATEIGVELRKKHVELPLLLAVDGVAELNRVDDSAQAWIVGGAATLTQLEEAVSSENSSSAPAADGVLRMLRVFASRPIRNRATLAGNIVTASPIGDMPPVLLALDAEVIAKSRRGERRIAIDQFFTAYRKTALAGDEIVRAIVVPKKGRAGDDVKTRFDTFKVSKRRDLDISIVAAAFRLDVGADQRIVEARLAFGGVAPTPVRAKKAEAMLVGRRLSAVGVDDDLADFADVLAQLELEFSPIDDVRAGKEYRRGLCSSLFAKFLRGEHSNVDVDGAFVEEKPWSPPLKSRALAHDCAKGHVTGSALYVGDSAMTRPMLEVWPVTVPHARAKITRRDATKARAMPGVRAVLFSEDIPGHNDVGAIRHDEILLAVDEAKFHGHPVALVVADTIDNARRAAAAVVVEAEPLPAIVGIRAAMQAQSWLNEPHVIARGDDIERALSSCKHVVSAEVEIGGQEHFYLETHAAFADVVEDEVQVYSSTQHPSEIQAVVSHVLDVPRNKIVVTSPRMGGGFGGKETQGNTWAALAALAAFKLREPVRVQLDRDVDMQLTGKRHPFLGTYRVGFDDDGKVRAFDVQLVSDGGWALDLSESILDRALFHLDNAYFFESVRFEGRVARTNTTSHTAFRGFGGPQGMLVVEDALSRVALKLGIAPEIVRERNFYRSGQETPYGQIVDDHRVPKMWNALWSKAKCAERRQAIDDFNAKSPWVKRGLAITPVKFGISFTASFLNQAGALVVVYRDGSVQVNHGGTEMGQGLHTKILGIVMRELGVTADQVRVMKTATDKVPNTSATAASSGSDLNGAAVKKACEELRARLQPVAAALLEKRVGGAINPADVAFLNGYAMTATSAGISIPLSDVVEAAYLRQTPLSATGFYRTPDIGYDRKAGRGKPFHYFAYGVAVSEVELDGLTGMKRVRRVDVLHDVGDSLNPQIDRGQIEGGFLQGVGWLTSEELKWDEKGRLLTHSASTYQIPSFWDAPAEFHVELLSEAPQHSVVHGSKAVGEPPLMLAFSVREALRDAVHAFGGGDVELPSPVTHEVLFHAVRKRRALVDEKKRAAE